jgi:hypothetical protein
MKMKEYTMLISNLVHLLVVMKIKNGMDILALVILAKELKQAY